MHDKVNKITLYDINENLISKLSFLLNNFRLASSTKRLNETAADEIIIIIQKSFHLKIKLPLLLSLAL